MQDPEKKTRAFLSWKLSAKSDRRVRIIVQDDRVNNLSRRKQAVGPTMDGWKTSLGGS